MERNELKRSALAAGATGLVGREIVQLLARDDQISEVRVLIRSPLPEKERSPRIRELISGFERLEQHPDWFKVDLVFSALGTTISKAGSQAAFRRVDFDYPLAIAKAARAAGARHFLFVSALGADARSLFFYNRVKGELEDAILALGFPSVTIARPSLLLGERSERRFGEELAKKFSWLLPSPWAGIPAVQVAAALVKSAREDMPGVHILENKRMRMGI
ncbi:MAG: hypothetical protein A2010_14610 [Nitrospirae bacterium GWD2_57_9]|nr:MAG: hypothetical protein A2010_14610 [Nitrospirae bacterium GWD2_57_9]